MHGSPNHLLRLFFFMIRVFSLYDPSDAASSSSSCLTGSFSGVTETKYRSLTTQRFSHRCKFPFPQSTTTTGSPRRMLPCFLFWWHISGNQHSAVSFTVFKRPSSSPPSRMEVLFLVSTPHPPPTLHFSGHLGD